jgi:hypothetical protein
VYVVFGDSPVFEYDVAVEPVLARMVDQVELLLVDLSILYPVIADPPLFDGAIQERSICDDEAAVAVRPVGGDGAVIGVGVVADAGGLDSADVPPLFDALIS